MKRRWPESNIRKYFLVLFTARRNFIPILSIYFLTIPNSTAQQIGMYTAAGYVIGMIFQIPAWYRWDKRWNKKTLVISKICLVLSSLAFVLWYNFRFFLIGSVLNTLWWDAFSSGNTSAFLHDTLSCIGKWDKFKKISSSIRWRVSFLSVFFIIALPFFTTISMNFPFKIGLGIDIIGLIIAFSLFPVRSPKHQEQKISIRNIVTTIKKTRNTWFYSLAIFSAIIWAFLMADGAYRTPYLQSLWYPIAWIGLVMWWSRLVRFIIWQYAHKIEKIIPLQKLMIVETIIFAWYYMLASYIHNPYVVWGIFSLVIWYFRWRSDIYVDHLIKLLPEKQYKSTMLSLQSLISGFIKSLIVFFIWFIMTDSYKLWFLILWILLFVMLSITYMLFKKETKNIEFKV